MSELTDETIGRLLKNYQVSYDLHLFQRTRTYILLLLQWNSKISLTTVRDPVEIINFHFGESLFAASAVPIVEGRLADIGTGAGFPGIPLKMAIPGLKMTLVEANSKKAAFLEEVCRTLQLDDVDVLRSRMEDVSSEAGPFDFITARALGNHDDLLDWSAQHLAPSGTVVLWLGEDDVKIISGRLRWTWLPPLLIPGSQRRYILAGKLRR